MHYRINSIYSLTELHKLQHYSAYTVKNLQNAPQCRSDDSFRQKISFLLPKKRAKKNQGCLQLLWRMAPEAVKNVTAHPGEAPGTNITVTNKNGNIGTMPFGLHVHRKELLSLQASLSKSHTSMTRYLMSLIPPTRAKMTFRRQARTETPVTSHSSRQNIVSIRSSSRGSRSY